MEISNKIASDITVFSKYAKHLKSKNRRETWDEIWDRVEQMFQKKYPKQKELVSKTVSQARKKRILGSMRSLQFGGLPIEKNNSRVYNCAYESIEDIDFFSRLMFLLLGGTGMGYSVQDRHLSKLPPITNPKKERKFLVGDSIEGWADAVKVLMNAYFEGRYLPKFDFSDIREKGSELVTAGGKAPGPEPLMICLVKINALLSSKSVGSKLTSVEASDICCYIADAVLSGGIRRAAMICLFDRFDEGMLAYKSGTWYDLHPYRGRVNVSSVFGREERYEPDFFKMWEFVTNSGSGEPGVYFTNDFDYGTNPCLPPWAKLRNPIGVVELKDVTVGERIWSKEGWTTVTNKWATDIKEVYEYKTTAGIFYGTENHRIVQNGKKIEVDKAEKIDIINGPVDMDEYHLSPISIMDGLVLGDGSVHKASNNLIHLFIGEKDGDYFDSEISRLIKEHRPGISEKAYTIKTNITVNELPKTFERRVPKRYIENDVYACGFLRGLYSANGTVTGNRIFVKINFY